MPQQSPSRFWIIQHPSSGGNVVAKFDTDTNAELIPDEVADHPGFNIVEVADRSTLFSKTVDQTGLTQTELDLLSTVYPVQ